MTQTYTAVYRADPSGNWLVHIDGLDGCHTFGRTYRAARANIREALAAWLDVDDAEGLHIDDSLDLDEISEHVTKVRHLRNEYVHFGAKVADETRSVIAELTSRGVSLRDAADLLGLSHQRVAQLLKQEPKTSTRSVATSVVSGRRAARPAASGRRADADRRS